MTTLAALKAELAKTDSVTATAYSDSSNHDFKINKIVADIRFGIYSNKIGSFGERNWKK